jgi:transcriptional regulator with XRE-family HTH domain
MTDRAAFGLELRRARERRGLTLDQISEQTKVSAAHFAGLERGDISRWPSGIFRRAFIRGYAATVGLDPDETVVRFGQVFPETPEVVRDTARAGQAIRSEAWEPEGAAVEAAADAPADAPVLRLALDQSLADGSARRLELVGRRVLSGTIDVSLALLPAALLSLIAGRGWFWLAATCIGLAGHLGFFGLMGTTPGSWLSARRRVAQPRPLVPASSGRRRSDGDVPVAGRRHVPRHATRPLPAHAHRVRH